MSTVVHVIDGNLVGYMTTKEVAVFLKVQPSTIRVWIKRGKVIPLTIKADGHQLNFIEISCALKKFREMYPEIIDMAESRTKQHSHFRVNGKNRKFGC